MQDDERLLIFAKFPEKGMVKTRLAHKTGEETAVELYRCFVERRDRALPESRLCAVDLLPPPGGARGHDRMAGRGSRV